MEREGLGMHLASGAHAAAAGKAAGFGGPYLIFILLIVAMMVWMFTQQSRQQKQKRQMQASLGVGERVITVGGIVGTIREVEGRTFKLEVADGVTLQVTKSAIGGRYQGDGEASS